MIDNICNICDGSGEGYSDGTTCVKCNGMGTTSPEEEPEEEPEL